MTKRAKKTRAVDIEITRQHVAVWKCAAALEPVPPTWLAPTWRVILAMPVDVPRLGMTLIVPARLISRGARVLDQQELGLYITWLIEEHALSVLERHGLQRIRGGHEPTTDLEDEIPF